VLARVVDVFEAARSVWNSLSLLLVEVSFDRPKGEKAGDSETARLASDSTPEEICRYLFRWES